MNRHLRQVVGYLALTLLIGAGLSYYTLNWTRGPGAVRDPLRHGPAARPESDPSPLSAGMGLDQRPLEPRMEEGLPTYDLVLREADGMVQGPVLQVREGELARFRVRNGLDQPATVHWHGIALPAGTSSAIRLSDEPIPPGGTSDFQFRPARAGTHWYHSHLGNGRVIIGPLIVEP
ncbi:MAG: multicopper oxidase domain-containing protein [Bacillota bacterium]